MKFKLSISGFLCNAKVYIPQSLQGTIQANDKRYYQRRNYKAEPMEDYQVRDVMNRFKHPIVVPEISHRFFVHKGILDEYELVLNLVNKGVVTAKAFGMDMFFPSIVSPALLNPAISGVNQFYPEDPFMEYKGFRFRNEGSPSSFLFPDTKVNIFGGPSSSKLVYAIQEKYWEKAHLLGLYITTYGDDMPPKRSEYPFNEFYKL